MQLTDLFDIYSETVLVDRTARANTHYTYHCGLQACKPFFQERSILKDNDLIALQEWLREQGYMPATVRSYILVVKKVLIWASQQDYLDDNLVMKVLAYHRAVPRKRNGGHQRKQVVHEDVEAIIAHYKPAIEASPEERTEERVARLTYMRDRAMIALLAGSALRISEMLSLDRIRFDRFFIGWDGSGEIVINVLGKGAQPGQVPVLNVYIWPLREYLEARGPDDKRPLFIPHGNRHNDEFRLTRQHVNYLLQQVSRTLDIESVVTPHSFRHYYLQNLRDKGMPLDGVQDIARHKDMNITKRYYVGEQDIRKLVDILKQLDD